MSNIYTGSATSALNEKEYINQIYDKIGTSQKDTLKENYDASIKQLDTGVQTTQNKTNDYLKRAYVENGRANTNSSHSPAGTGLSRGGNGAQAALTLGNQNQANVTALNQQQAAANQEFERQRKLLADQYATAIKQAQADNDMHRAQALYDAAKAEEERLRALRQGAATLMAGKGDNSIMDAIGTGAAVTPDTTTPTWEGVTRNEESINKIYDAQQESERLAAQQERDKSLSDLEAQQQEQTRQTDKNLTQTYVNALKSNGNYLETQTAAGQGSGTAAQARLARESGLIKDLTDLRTLQLGKDAATEQQKLGIVQAFGDKIAKSRAAADLQRVKALYGAAKDEEQALVDEQQFLGQQLAKQNNYSVLGALYGLTQDQIDRLQGTGAYAPVYYGSPKLKKEGYYTGWSNEELQAAANSAIAAYVAKAAAGANKNDLQSPTSTRFGTA